MPTIDSVVNNIITRGSLLGQQVDFNTGLIMAPSTVSEDEGNVLTFTSAPQVAAYEGFSDSDAVVASANRYFGQSPRPTRLKICISAQGADVTNYNAAVQSDGAFYMVWTVNRTSLADVTALVNTVIAGKRIFSLADNSALTLAGNPPETVPDDISSGDLLAWAFNQNSRRILSFYQADNGNHIDAAVASFALGRASAGSYTLNLKNLEAPTSPVSDTQYPFLERRNANVFTRIGGVGAIFEGYVTNGEWFDAVKFEDELDATMQLEVFNTLRSMDKVPLTDTGTALLENAVRRALSWGVLMGGVARFEITVLPVEDLLLADIADRKYNGIRWTAYFTNAIHKVSTTGVIAV